METGGNSDQLTEALDRHEQWLRNGRPNQGAVDFSGWNLRGCDLRNRNLSGARFYRADLTQAQLAGAVLRGANFDSAVLEDIHAKGADLSEASLHSSNCRSADFEYAKFCGAILYAADLGKAKCRWADLSKADLRSAKLEDTDLQGAGLAGANLSWGEEPAFPSWRRRIALLMGLRKGPFRLDANYCAGTHFPVNSADSWSILRHFYTGPRYLFLVLFTLLAFLPWVGKAMAWSALHEMEYSLLNAIDNRSDSSSQVLEQLLEKHRARLNDPDARWSVVALLFGFHRGPVVALVNVFLFLYYIVRGTLTYFVSGLRDEEERTGVSPSWETYRPWWRAHCCLIWMTPPALAILIFRLGAILCGPVYLPS